MSEDFKITNSADNFIYSSNIDSAKKSKETPKQKKTSSIVKSVLKNVNPFGGLKKLITGKKGSSNKMGDRIQSSQARSTGIFSKTVAAKEVSPGLQVIGDEIRQDCMVSIEGCGFNKTDGKTMDRVFWGDLYTAAKTNDIKAMKKLMKNPLLATNLELKEKVQSYVNFS